MLEKHQEKHEEILQARKIDRVKYLETIAWLLENERGRRFLYNYFDMSWLHMDPMSTDPLITANIIGRQQAARDLAVDCMEADFDGYMRMQKDGILERKANQDA